MAGDVQRRVRSIGLILAALVGGPAWSQTDFPAVPGEVAVGRPKVNVAERTINLGRLREGDAAEAKFIVENHGDQALLISEVQSTCACTVAELGTAEKTVAPGRSVTVKVRFDSKGRPGPQSRTLQLVTNDPDEPRLPLTLTVQVDAVFRMNPPTQIDFRTLRRGETAARGVEVIPVAEEGALELVSVATGSTSITYTAEPLAQGKRQGYRLSFSVTPEAAIGQINADAHVVARVGGETAEQVLKLRGEIVGEIAYLPLLVNVTQPILPGNKLSNVRVYSPAQKPFKIISATAGPNVEPSLAPGTAPGEYQVSLTIRPDAPPGPFGAYLSVRTDHPDLPLLRVPVFGNVAPRIAAEPLMVVLDAAAAGGGKRRVRLESGNLAPFGVMAVSVDPPIASGRWVEPAAGQGPYVQYVELSIAADAPAGDHEATMMVKTNLPPAEEVRVPIVVRR